MSVVLVGVVRGVGGRQSDVPGQKLLDTVDRMIRDSGEHIRQVRLRIDSAEFGRPDQTVDGRGALSADVGSREEKILAAESDTAQSAFRCIMPTPRLCGVRALSDNSGDVELFPPRRLSGQSDRQITTSVLRPWLSASVRVSFE